MNALLSTPVLPTFAWGLIGVGILLWFWGTLPLLWPACDSRDSTCGLLETALTIS